MKASHTFETRSAVFWGCALILLFFVVVPARSQVIFQDFFTNRQTILTTNGTITGDNSTATFETGEPQHGGKPGGHSLWVSWVAPTNGVATFDTHGSSFDTLLSAYVLNPTNATTVDKLQEQARNDDDPGFQPTSLIQFGAIAGHRYEIAVDGYEGATGTVVLNWSFLPSSVPPPIIVSTPNDQAAKQGDTVTLSVNMISSGNLQLAWFLNNVEDTVQTGTNYVISSLQGTNVGRYQLRITVGNGNNRVRFFTTPVEIQINSEGSTNTLAVDKLLDSTTSPLIGDDGSHGNGPAIVRPLLLNNAGTSSPSPMSPTVGVVRGYNGSQVFNTTFATTDPAEPPHCGVTGGASYWLMYQPPANGTVTFDTIGSSYDTVMEIYTYNGALNSYADLISVGCDNDTISSHGPSRVTFQALKTRPYIIAVDGVNGARGTAWLNYSLNTNQSAQPPQLQASVATQTVLAGSTVTLAPNVSGAPPLKFSWERDGTSLSNIIVPFLQMTNVTPSHTGNYSLIVTNDLGSLVVNMPIHVVPPTVCQWLAFPGGAILSFPTVSNFRYTLLQSSNLAGPWTNWGAAIIGTGDTFTTNIIGSNISFFRLRIE